MADRSKTVRALLDVVRAEGRAALSAPECRTVCEAYAIPLAKQAFAASPGEAVRLAREIGYPVAVKVVSSDILHKTEAGGVLTGLASDAEVERGFRTILQNAATRAPRATVAGVQVQEMLPAAPEVLVGTVRDPTFGPLVAFGLGGVQAEILNDVTFRLAPAGRVEALSMLDGIAGAAILSGFRGAAPVDRDALASVIQNVSQLVHDCPAIREVDLNPVFAGPAGATAADVRMLVDFAAETPRHRPSDEEILAAMRRIMNPAAVAVIGASAEAGKIGHSVMKNLIDGGYRGAIYPINPGADAVLGHRCHRSIKDVPGVVDLAVFAIPAARVPGALAEAGEKGVAGAVMIPSGFSEVGNVALEAEMMAVARRYGVRVLGPNIYGLYSTPYHLCATFCTPYDVRGRVALSSQSGGVGMSIIGFSRSTKMGVSAIVGLGNKADVDEDDLLAYFEHDDHTDVIVMHAEDLKDGRAFADAARRVSKKKPIVMLKAGRTAAGARAAASHTAALAGNDKVYDDVLRQSGVVRARGLDEMLQFARGLPVLPTPRGENVVIITGAGGSGVLLSDACADNGLELMAMPKDLDQAFRRFIPPFGASGNPVDITGGEPPSTYRDAITLALEDPRIHALILGYWHTIITPPMAFARLTAEAVAAARRRGIDKPIVASLVGDVEVEEAATHLYQHGIVAYPYTTELPVAVLGAKYAWARTAGLVAGDEGRVT
jgi:acetyl coenzyme A synthetase (ADP forming)-like protein